jgi:hypothetical protein
MRSGRALAAGLVTLAALGAACALDTRGREVPVGVPDAAADVVSRDARSDADFDASTTSSDDAATSGPQCPCADGSGDICCIPKGGATAYCAPKCPTTAIAVTCRSSDPNTDSECCWNNSDNGVSAGSSTALAGSCEKRTVACTSMVDCKESQDCKVTTCGKFVVGTCSGPAPACP